MMAKELGFPKRETIEKIWAEYGLDQRSIKEAVEMLKDWLQLQPHLPKEEGKDSDKSDDEHEANLNNLGSRAQLQKKCNDDNEDDIVDESMPESSNIKAATNDFESTLDKNEAEVSRTSYCHPKRRKLIYENFQDGGGSLHEARLERWLIRCKNSMERTKQSIDMYYTLKSFSPEMMSDYNIQSKWFKTISKLGWQENSSEMSDRWIGRAGVRDRRFMTWPPRSPDMTACDFFLWGYLKDRVFVPPFPCDLEELRTRIRDAAATVTEGAVHLKTFPCEIHIRHIHNHSMRAVDALRHRRPIEEVQEAFIELFRRGDSPSSA
ncbi:hypothetical protein ANN_26720 [Periplaneta americana]|uniref:Uncharacterized protein n=1 Tax=Periplaneta americana TaxID=6978 RepID=A0ABQ8RZJ0_PERAM|nr:hypothetical protein ANN_26720 [Periplaneta americana]